MIVPLVSSLCEDAVRSVPDSLRQASYALGSTKFQTSFRVVVPAAVWGIWASFILAFSRAVGETMIVSIAAGQQAKVGFNPVEPVQTMTAYIVQVALGDVSPGTLEYRTIFVVGACLFLVTFLLNFLSNRLRRKFQEVRG